MNRVRGLQWMPLFAVSLLLFTIDVGRVEGGIFTISQEQEIHLGQQLAMQVETRMPMLNDWMIEGYVNNLGQHLAQFSRRSNIGYRFRVPNANEINAFALPGGFIYVNRALLEAAENESELAGVMAHEISHVVARHSVEQLERAQKYNLGLGLIGSILGNRSGALIDLTKLGSQVAATGFFMKYSRKAERQADELGVYNVYAAGYDPRGMITFFEKLQSLRRQQPNLLNAFFSSHPDIGERLHTVSQLVHSLPARPGLLNDTEAFQQMRFHLTGSRSPFQGSPLTPRRPTNPRVRRF